MAPLAFAHDDQGKSEDSNRGKKAFMFTLPFSVLGTTTTALQDQIKSLREALTNLKAQREALDDNDDDNDDNDGDDRHASSTRAMRDTLKMEVRETKADLNQAKRELKSELRFARSLARGMSGDDVRDLQELLAQDSSIFSIDLITGFFGPKTEEALRKFQKKFGIESIGIFGPKTQARILALFVGRELPPGIIRRLGLETSTTTPGQGF
ncbi:MAG: peptidoglycan-binding domain-containing protein, partial [Patescibacteria group bacterium]